MFSCISIVCIERKLCDVFAHCSLLEPALRKMSTYISKCTIVLLIVICQRNSYFTWAIANLGTKISRHQPAWIDILKGLYKFLANRRKVLVVIRLFICRKYNTCAQKPVLKNTRLVLFFVLRTKHLKKNLFDLYSLMIAALLDNILNILHKRLYQSTVSLKTRYNRTHSMKAQLLL